MKKPSKYWNEKMVTLSADELHSVQSKALLKQLAYIGEHSAFYQKKFLNAQIDIKDIKTIDDLKKIPFTIKQELRESLAKQKPLGLHAATGIENVIRVYSTSGTTGVPTYIGLTRNDRLLWRESANRAMWTCGMRPEHIVPLPIGTFFIAASYGEAIENLGATLVPVGVGATDRLLGAIQNLGANFILSTASFPFYLINYCEKRNINTKRLGIRGFMVGGEPGGGIPELRKQVEDQFGAVVQETMGNGDMMGLMWGECEYKNGMHFLGADTCHTEIIDPDTGDVLDIKKGVKGELIYSSLNRECQPLIRFRTRDHIEVTQTECACGRTGFCIKCIGRTDDMIILSGVNVYPSAIRDVISSLAPDTTGEILITLDSSGHSIKPPLKIKTEHGKGVSNLEALKLRIENLLREKLVFSSDIILVEPGTL
ncbi:MAG: phenylacetate--CoA ligase family protein, partial [Desulfobacula sp.]|nr:phenylacetate--CoA ligase family protein [Desulfobacula sp.]